MYWERCDLCEHLDKDHNGGSEASEASSQSLKEAVHGGNQQASGHSKRTLYIITF